MTLEATFRQDGRALDYTAVAAMTAGKVVQLPDGRAGVITTDLDAGQLGAVHTQGIFKVQKTANIVLLRGGRAFWDHSADTATFRTVNDRDFYLGTLLDDAASAATVCYVDLNAKQNNTLDLIGGPILSVPTGTQAVGAFGHIKDYGGAKSFALTATSEAQCIDALSVDRVAVASNGIAEFVVRLGTNGSTADVDLNFGLANGTSTTDADAVTEHVYFHIDGGALDLLAQSADGTTTVAAVDTTVNVTAGAAVSDRFECWIDFRDPADIQLYVNGANVLPASVFKLDAATGPIGLLFHLEKASGTATAGPIFLDRAVLRTMEQ